MNTLRHVVIGLKSNKHIDVFFDRETQSLKVVSMESVDLPRRGKNLLKDLYVKTGEFIMGIIENHIHYTTIENNFILPGFDGFLDNVIFYSLVYEYEGAMLDKNIPKGKIIASIRFLPAGLTAREIPQIAREGITLKWDITIGFTDDPQPKKHKIIRPAHRVSKSLRKSYEDIKEEIEEREKKKLEEAAKMIKEKIRSMIKSQDPDKLKLEDIPEEVIDKFVEYIFNEKEYLSFYREPHPLVTWHPSTVAFYYTLEKFNNRADAEKEVKKYDRQTYYISSFRAILIEHNGEYYVGMVEDRGRD